MPSINKLTDQQARSAKPREKAFKLFDGGGLYLWVSPKGGKVWRLQYRLVGKQQTLAVGPYPKITLADARRARQEARDALDRGEDPAAPKKAASGRGMTFQQASEAYWTGRKDLSESYLANVRRALEMHLYPTLGSKRIGSIGRDDLMAPLAVMDAAHLYTYVRKTRMWAGQVFEWAIEHGHAKVNPAALINPSKAFGKRAVEHHASLPLAETGEFLRRLAHEGRLLSVLGCRLLILTWVRTDELRRMKWSEIEGDVWRIPAERMKRRREHLVPLSRQAIELLDELRARQVSDYVFPNDRRLDRPMSENSILYLIGRIGYGGRLTGHGFRSMASTWANEGGYRADAIERQLAHAPEDRVRAAYNQAEFMPERRRMLQAWADWLDAQERQSPRAPTSTPSSRRRAG